MKTCSKCGIEKEDCEFSQGRAQCRICYAQLAKAYYQANKEKYAEWMKGWYQNNKEKHVERAKEYKRNRCKTDPLFAIACRLRDRVRHAFQLQGYRKNTKTATMLGCPFEQLLEHLGIISMEDLTGKHVDHICPLAQAKNEEELYKLSHFSNLQLLPAEENLSKNDSWTHEGEEMCRKLLGRAWVD